MDNNDEDDDNINNSTTHLRNDLYCVGWGVKLYSLTRSLRLRARCIWKYCMSVISKTDRATSRARLRACNQRVKHSTTSGKF